MSSQIDVSIIMSAYNANLFIKEAIESILIQTYKNFELIIVNDGSTDNTLEIITSFTDSRIKVLSQNNKGQDAALNYGFKNCIGKFIKFIDSDDLINEKMIELQVADLLKNPNLISYSEWYRFYGTKPSNSDLQKKQLYWASSTAIDFLINDEDGPMLQCGIMLIPRRIIEEAGLWDERLILYNDTEYFTRLILFAGGIVFTKGAQLFYRSGNSSSLSMQNSRKYFESTFLATGLIEDRLINIENSKRVRLLLSNMYFRRLYDMYPYFSDLMIMHETKIKELGHPSLKIKGSKVHNFIYEFCGWKVVKQIHRIKKYIKG